MGASVMAVLRALTTVFSISLGISPAPDYYHMYKHKTTGDKSIMPVFALFCNSFTWMIYGYLQHNIVPLFVVCTFSAVTSVTFMIIYYIYATDRPFVRKLATISGSIATLIAIYAAIGIAGVTHQSKDQVTTILGYIATVCNFGLYIAPLATIRHVLRVRNASSMPITMSSVSLINTSLWTSVSTGDTFVLVPNVFGVVLSAFQIALYWCYRPGKYSTAVEADDVRADSIAIKVMKEEEEAGTRLRSPVYVSVTTP